MASRRAHRALQDMLSAIGELESYTAGMDFQTYARDGKTRRSVERLVEIISEASRKVPTEHQKTQPHIPWNDIHAIGNRLRHDYRRVDDLIMWRIATLFALELKQAIEQILSHLDQP